MMQVKAILLAAACALAFPVIAADADKVVDKVKAEAKAEAKKPAAAREKIAGQIAAPATDSKDSIEAVKPVAQPFTLKNARWVKTEEKDKE